MYFISLPLPPFVQTLVHRHCCGLAQVDWTEASDLFIQLQKIEEKNQGMIAEIEEQLKQVDCPPFTLSLQGIYAHFRKGVGRLWVGVGEHPALTKLSQSIAKSLKGLEMRTLHQPPHIFLGTFQGLSEERLASYLEAHASFFSDPFLVTSFSLIESHQTEKHTIYHSLHSFPLRT